MKEIYRIDDITHTYFTYLKWQKKDFMFANNMHGSKSVVVRYFDKHGVMRFKNVIEDSCASHNFCPFVGSDGLLYGIGGMDSWKNSYDWHNADTFEKFKMVFKNKYDREYEKGEKEYKQAYNKLRAVREPMHHANGLYLFTSENALDWELVQKEPIITFRTKGFEACLSWKSSEFDGHISVVIHNGEYFLYCRDNIAPDVRYVQVGRSKDLYNWDFQRITTDIGYIHGFDNFYSGVAYNYNKKLVLLIPHITPDYTCMQVLFSTNGIDYKHYFTNYYSKPFCDRKGDAKSFFMPVGGQNKGSVYMQYNYRGLKKKTKMRLVLTSLNDILNKRKKLS